MYRFIALFTLVPLSFTAGCVVSVPDTSGVLIACEIQEQCPPSTYCLGAPGICRSGSDACVDEDIAAGTAQLQPDATTCSTPDVARGLCARGSCVLSVCGDGVTDGSIGELCDDGNVVSEGEGECLADCSGLQVCGNDRVEGTEACDDGDTLSNGEASCVADCTAMQICGDSLIVGTEACDDGNTVDNGELGCVADCSAVQVCGDNLQQGTEACDDGDVISNGEGSCIDDCTAVQTCGDGTLQGTEGCEDGNAITEACPYGRTSPCLVCDATCELATVTAPYCGDGTPDITFGEQCDDGDADNLNACSNQCRPGDHQPIWEFDFRQNIEQHSTTNVDPNSSNERGIAIATGPSGECYVINSDSSSNANGRGIQKFSATGPDPFFLPLWRRETNFFAADPNDRPTFIAAVAVRSDAVPVVVGRDGTELWLGTLDPESGLVLELASPPTGTITATAMDMRADDSFVVVGDAAGSAWLSSYAGDLTVAPGWPADGVTVAGSTATSVVALPNGEVFVGGTSSGNRWVNLFDDTGAQRWAAGGVTHGGGSVTGIAAGLNGELWAVGHTNEGSSRIWLARVDPIDGALVPGYELLVDHDPTCNNCNDEAFALSSDQAGDLIVGGMVGQRDGFCCGQYNRYPFLMKYSSDGTFTARWANVKPFDDPGYWGYSWDAGDELPVNAVTVDRWDNVHATGYFIREGNPGEWNDNMWVMVSTP